jgi:hypothetical protein
MFISVTMPAILLVSLPDCLPFYINKMSATTFEVFGLNDYWFWEYLTVEDKEYELESTKAEESYEHGRYGG